MKISDKDTGLSLDELKRRLSYNPETGVFLVKLPRGGRRAGTVAGGLRTLGYRTVNLLGFHYKEHRLAWFYVHGTWPSSQLDHVNGVRSDNRLSNLRECSQAENSQNHGTSRASKTGVTGVRFLPRDSVYHASITVAGKAHHLGSFNELSAATSARVEAKSQLHRFQPTDPLRSAFRQGASA